MCGAPSQKGTGISGTLDDLEDGNAIRCDGELHHTHQSSVGRRDSHGNFLLRLLARYPSDLTKFLAIRILRSFKRMLHSGAGPGGWQRHAVVPQRITAWGARAAGDDDAATDTYGLQLLLLFLLTVWGPRAGIIFRHDLDMI